MKAFIDTSSLFKKYADEQGSKEFAAILETILEIIVAPTTILEMHSVIQRRLSEKSLGMEDAQWIEKEFSTDYSCFGVVEWNEELLDKSILFIHKHRLKILDSIQLAAAQMSGASIFVTSDHRLSLAAKKEFPSVLFV
jgi:predicted nucleic acid-binding protein